MNPWLDRTARLLRAVSIPATLGISVGVAALGCQYLENGASTGTSGTDAGTLGAVCISGGSGADGLECCQTNGSACMSDYECCGGSCSGDGVTEGSGTCSSASSSPTCTAALGSRCYLPGSCACTTADDCCQENTGAICAKSSVTTAGLRCCLTTGIPCGGDGDCCSGACDTTAFTCD